MSGSVGQRITPAQFPLPGVDARAYLTAGSSDHTAEIAAMFTAEGGGKYYRFPMDVVLDLSMGNYADVPANSVLDGEGGTLTVTDGDYNTAPYNPSGFHFNSGCTDVVSRRFTVTGDNAGASWDPTDQWQSAVFTVGANFGGGTTGVARLTFEDLTFEDLWGFAIHDVGWCDGLTARRIVTTNCHNGFNANGDNLLVEDYTNYGSEGLEVAGAYGLIRGYRAYDALRCGISLGGWISGSSLTKGGWVIDDFVINGVRRASASSDGFGIIVADAVKDATIANGYVEEADSSGYYVGQYSSGSGSVNPPERVQLIGLTAVNCGLGGGSPSTARYGFWSSRSYVDFLNCKSRYTGSGSYQQAYNFHIDGADNSMAGCSGDGALTKDIIVNSSGARLRFGNSNRYGDGSLQIIAGGSLIPTGNGAYRAYTSGNYTLGLADRFVTMDPTGSARTFTCLSAVGIAGWEYIIRHSGSTGTVIFNPDGSETVGGATTKTLAAGAILQVISDGANWQIVSSQGTVT